MLLSGPVKLVVLIILVFLEEFLFKVVVFSHGFFRLIQQKVLTTLGNRSPQFLALLWAAEHLGDAVDFFCHGILQRIDYGPIVRAFGP